VVRQRRRLRRARNIQARLLSELWCRHAFIEWLVSPEGQKAINDYKIKGHQLFFANANVPGA